MLAGGLTLGAELVGVDVDAVGEAAALDVGAVGPLAVGLLLGPAGVELALAGVVVFVGGVEADSFRFDLVAVPVDALLPDDVLHAGEDAVLAVAPVLVDVDDGFEAGHEIFGGEDAERLAVGGEGGLALLFALAAADVDLVGDDFGVAAGALHQWRDADFVGADLGAVVVGDRAGVGVAVGGAEGDLELAVEELLAVVVLNRGVFDVAGVDGEDLDVRGGGQAEVGAVLVGEVEGAGALERGELGQGAAHDVADVVPTSIQRVEAGFGDVLHQAHDLGLLQPVVLDVLAGGEAEAVAAVGVVGAVFVGDAVEDLPLAGVEGAAAGDGDADHVHPVFFAAGFGAVVFEVQAVGLGEELGFLLDVHGVVVAVGLGQGADHAVAVDLEVLVVGELVGGGVEVGRRDFAAGHLFLLLFWGGGGRSSLESLTVLGPPGSASRTCVSTPACLRAGGDLRSPR